GFVDSAGVKIHYTDEGKGEPIVLIHGLLGTIDQNWGQPGIISALKKNYRVIGIDLRGHGQSEKTRDPLGYGFDLVKDVVRVLDHLGIEKAHIVSYSYGGTVAIKLLATYPERMLSVVLGETSWAEEGNPEVAEFYTQLADALDQGEGFTALVKSMTPPGKQGPSEEELQEMTKSLARMYDLKALSALLRGSHELSVARESLCANKIPVLLLFGEKSRQAQEGAADMEGVMKEMKVYRIKGADHFDVFAHPRFLKEIQGFIKEQAS
ncbi:MAG: alpha/beta hydrolase, partial [Planctomycetes bacterium]|nr:alpha/beta hydrolase [Planctomycetota bacterium]